MKLLTSDGSADKPYNYVPNRGHVPSKKEPRPDYDISASRLGRSSAECTFDDFARVKQRKLEEHLRSQRELGELASSPVGPPVSSYRFASRDIRDMLKSGLIKLDQAVVIDAYLQWREQASVTVLKDMASDDRVARLSPKRGNIAYSRRMARKQNDILSSMDRLQWDWEVPNARPGMYHYTSMIAITLTYDQNSITCQQAWAGLSDQVKKFKVLISRALGRDLRFTDRFGRKRSKRVPISISAITSKEGTMSGYPAPHMLIMLERPVRTFRHQNKQGEVTHRLQSDALLSKLRDCWPNGFIDVSGIVSGGGDQEKDGARDAVRYEFKYMAKSYRMDPEDPDQPISKASTIARNTFAWQKLFALQPLNVSRHFKNRLNPRRLDTMGTESQQPNGVWKFESSEKCSLSDYVSVISDLNLRWASEMPFSAKKRGLPGHRGVS